MSTSIENKSNCLKDLNYGKISVANIPTKYLALVEEFDNRAKVTIYIESSSENLPSMIGEG